jgi:hypothetical protein
MSHHSRREIVKLILFHLNLRGWRAEYRPVGELIGLPAMSVSSYLPAGPYAGVIVNAKTGKPGDGGTYREDLGKSHIVSSAAELRALISGDWLRPRRVSA